jgi:hypothetical protein
MSHIDDDMRLFKLGGDIDVNGGTGILRLHGTNACKEQNAKQR